MLRSVGKCPMFSRYFAHWKDVPGSKVTLPEPLIAKQIPCKLCVPPFKFFQQLQGRRNNFASPRSLFKSVLSPAAYRNRLYEYIKWFVHINYNLCFHSATYFKKILATWHHNPLHSPTCNNRIIMTQAENSLLTAYDSHYLNTFYFSTKTYSVPISPRRDFTWSSHSSLRRS